MGGAVSSGRDNNELIDNLMGGNYIRTRCVERVFRALDRADYMTPESRDQAYKDLAWRNGALHMSSPCIYSEVMEGLELKPGLSFLNVGSGTGYLSTLAGLILGSGGISHGVEVHSSVVDYANKKLSLFIANSPTLDEFDFCEPKFYVGNGLCLTPQQQPYDRVYCGAGCPDEYENYFKQLIKVGGVLVMPLNDTLLQVRRVGPEQWVSRSLLTVSFATLCVPPKDQLLNYVHLEEQTPPRLQVVARGVVRASMRRGVLRRHPELCEPAPRRAPPAACPRRICIPIEPGGAVEGLNILHDLDAETGANEMNALLSLVIRMDQNRVAGAIRFDGIDSSSEAHSHSEDSSDEGRPRRNRVDANTTTERRPRPTSGTDGRSDTDKSDEGHHSTRGRNSTVGESGTTSSDSRSSKNGKKSDRFRNVSGSKDRNGRDRCRNVNRSNDRNVRDRSRNGSGSKDRTELKSDRKNGSESKERKGRNSDRKNESESIERKGSKLDRKNGSGSKDRNERKSDRTSSDDCANPKSRRSRRDPDDDKSNKSDKCKRALPSGRLWAFEFQARERSSQPTTSSGAGRSSDTSTANSDNSGGKNSSDKTTSSRQGSCDCKNANDIIPSEVELCFRGSKLQGLSPSSSAAHMDWEEDKGEKVKETVVEDQTESSCNNKAKRQKLDSGIGENTPSGSSPDKSKTEESDTDERPSDSVTDDAAHSPGYSSASRRRVHKRTRCEARASSSSAEDSGAGSAGDASGARRRAPRRGRGYDARRVRLSIVMKRAIKELPLPYQLKKYVNLGRCFEF